MTLNYKELKELAGAFSNAVLIGFVLHVTQAPGSELEKLGTAVMLSGIVLTAAAGITAYQARNEDGPDNGNNGGHPPGPTPPAVTGPIHIIETPIRS